MRKVSYHDMDLVLSPFFTRANMKLLSGILLFLAPLAACQKQDATPNSELATGRLVRTEITIDDQGLNPRPRWEVDVAPLSFPGVVGIQYQQVKVFNLPDTATYKPGRYIQFRYQFVPEAQHTPWRTYYERMNWAAQMAWGDRLPELTLSDVQLSPARN